MGECEPRNFLQPCLLLLLRERSDHGYDLVNRLRELRVVDGDAGAVYRALRSLEHQASVRSTWHTSDAGPARRIYQITSAGLADLDRQAMLLGATHEMLHVFMRRYQPARDGEIDRGEGNGHVHHGQAGHGQSNGRSVPPAFRAGERAGR